MAVVILDQLSLSDEANRVYLLDICTTFRKIVGRSDAATGAESRHQRDNEQAISRTFFLKPNTKGVGSPNNCISRFFYRN